MQQRAEQMAMERKASVQIQLPLPERKMSFKEFVLGREPITEEEKLHREEMQRRAEQMQLEKNASVQFSNV